MGLPPLFPVFQRLVSTVSIYSFLGHFRCRGVVVRLPSPVQLFATPWTAAHQSPLSSTISWSLLIFMSIESLMLSNHLILCCPLLLLPIFPSFEIFFFEVIYFLLKDNYFTEFCCFLSNLNMNQP